MALGDFDLAEDAPQQAFVVALARWPREGVPGNPGAWITTTARRKALDRLRHDAMAERHRGAIEAMARLDAIEQGDDDVAIEARVALTLRMKSEV